MKEYNDPTGNRAGSELRPSVIAEIARWWQQCLGEAAQNGRVLEPADVNDVTAKFQCSDEEAIRGLGVGEHLHWAGSR